jgi:hypothetical protein
MKIKKFQIVTSFKPNSEILYSSIFPQIKDRLNGKLLNLNVPTNSPPETPRLVISSNDTVLNVGLNRFDLHVSIPGHIANDTESCMDYLKVKSNSLFGSLFKELKITYTWSGVVAHLDFPFGDKRPSKEIIKLIFDKLIAIDRSERELSSLNIRFGFIEGKFNKLFTISGYESKDITVPKLKAGQSLRLEMSKFPIAESGIQILLDINNKPNLGKNNSSLDDVKEIYKNLESSCESILADLNLSEVLNG